MQKLYFDDPVKERIDDLSSFVTKIRNNMQDYNYQFFLDLLDNVEQYDIAYKKQELDEFIKSSTRLIEQHQYRLGKEMLSQGYDINVK